MDKIPGMPKRIGRAFTRFSKSNIDIGKVGLWLVGWCTNLEKEGSLSFG